jgi:methylmalonyl-CoA/ethylmalonyl-CoA epimerase
MLVRDIHQAIENYRRILSVVDPAQVEQQIVYYDDFGVGEERLAFATFPSASGGCEVQFMQPKTPGTTLYRRLEKLGEHVHHIAFTAPDVHDVVRELNEQGVAIVEEGISHDPQIPWQYWSFVDPEITHGVLVELANNYDSVEGKWAAGEGVTQEPVTR